MISPSSFRQSYLSRIFLSSQENRLRAGWRLLLQTFLLFLLLGCFSLPIGIFLAKPAKTNSDQLMMLISEGVSFFAITASVFLARRKLDNRPIQSLGLNFSKKLVPDLLAGFLIASLSLAFIFSLEYLLGWVGNFSFTWNVQSPESEIFGTLLALSIFILVGWNEELLSRGYHLQAITSGTNLPAGVLISSVIFGVLHLFNPNATLISSIGIFLAGLFLSIGYIRTRQLWLSIGLHIGWNFSEGVLFGFPVSGWNGFQLTKAAISRPVLWTGGAFGPEGGLILLPGLLLGALLIYLYTLTGFRN